MFKNMVALVTGAMNGLGRHTAQRLVFEKAVVVGCDLRPDVELKLQNDLGSNFHFHQADIRSEEEMTKVFDYIIEKLGRLDLAVNCAGISAAHRIFSLTDRRAFDMETLERPIEINVLGTFNVCRLAAELMSSNELDESGCRGLIINNSGFYADQGRTGQVSISAAGGAIESMTLPMSRELGSQCIRVNTISPGIFTTPLTSSYDILTRTFLESLMAFPHRFGNCEEYTDLVFHIIQNKMINGEVIKLDGGLHLPNVL